MKRFTQQLKAFGLLPGMSVILTAAVAAIILHVIAWRFEQYGYACRSAAGAIIILGAVVGIASALANSYSRRD